MWQTASLLLLRVHSSCATGDIFGSLRCECGEQLIGNEMIEKEGEGAIIYLTTRRGERIGLMDKIRAYKLQENGLTQSTPIISA